MSNAFRRVLRVGQGSCAAPAIWTAILDTILWSVSAKYTAMEITSPTGKTTRRLGDAYVDDTALMVASNHQERDIRIQEIEATTHMQHIAQDFERKLFTTGGALALQKCFWYLISWKWAEDGSARMKTIQEFPSEIYLTKGYTREVPNKIKRKEVDESERTLGVRLNPSQDMKAEILFRHNQIKKWAEAINKSNLTRPDIYLAYNRILLMMVTYPMAVTTITETEF